MSTKLTQKHSASIPIFAAQGVDYGVGSPVLTGIQAKKITQSGAAPFSVVLADHGLNDMADSDYCVLLGGEDADVAVDESTITPQGFDILGGDAADVIHVVLVGRIKGMPDKDGNV